MKEFEGYVVLITGGGSGIGRGTTEAFIKEGAKVVIADNRQEAIDEVLGCIGEGVSGKRCDVTSWEDILELRRFVEERYEKVDVLVNCAGSVQWGNVEVLAEEDWDWQINLLLKSPYLVMKCFIPLLQKSQNPSVVNISSVGAIQNNPSLCAYGPAKLGVEKLSRQVTRDFFWSYIILS